MVFGHKNKRQPVCRERVVLMRLELCVEGKVITVEAEGAISVAVRDIPVKSAVPVTVPTVPTVQVAVPEPAVTPKAVQPPTTPPTAVSVSDNSLFLKLAGLRTELANAAKVPPYMIFNNKTLLEMVERLPADLQELSEVSGVGQSKLEKYGERFLEVIKGVAA